MGHFRIEIDAVGGHGCSRETKHGETVKPCGQDSCPDCMARKFVEEMKAKGMFSSTPATAVLRHWPGTDGEVVDHLLTGKRTGSF
jgi:hypothetical protein